MLNRVTNVFAEADRRADAGIRPWRVDGHPEARLTWLTVLFVLPLVLVGARLIHLQTALPGQFVDPPERTTESIEPIPSRDGRILSSDGRVLAYDVERFDVHAHYRWLEEPADPAWLRGRALSRLGRADRRQRDRIEAEEKHVLAERQEMWTRLARLLDMSSAEIDDRRTGIQQRIERIVNRVERRRSDRLSDDDPQRARYRVTDDDPWWWVAWKTLLLTLTTPPRRGDADPIVIEEELAHHELVQDVPRAVAAEIEAHPELYPGMRVRVTTRRVYPEGELAAHVIGSRLAIDTDELQRREKLFPAGDPLDYRTGDRIGKTGVEHSYDRYLRGVPGERRIVKNSRGEILESQILREPRVGRDVVLTLNVPLQERMERVLDDAIGSTSAGTGAVDDTAASTAAGGAIVAMDVYSGEVLVAASAPRFNLNLLVDPDPEEWRRAAADTRRPFFARATQMTLPPGSVFKTLTSVALLESGRFDPDAKIFCQGFLDNPNRYRCYIYRHYGVGHGEMDLTDAIARSCNVYFFTAARKVGPRPIVEWARRFGFGRPTGIDLAGEPGGNLPVPPGIDSSPQHTWYPGDTLGLAIGQSRLTATPLQIARMMAAVANGGDLVTPHVVRDFGPSFDGRESLPPPAHRKPRRIEGLSDGALSRLREGLEKVVSNPHGTGYKRVRLKQIAIAGKTGTAEVAGGKNDHAWFAGYVPAEEPRFAFAVVLEHGGSGGAAAGPAAKQLVEAMLELGVLEPARIAMQH